MATETARPAPTVLAPGVTASPDVQGGEPCIAGTRIETDIPYSWWRGGVGWPAIRERYPTLPSEAHWAAGAAFAAGRLYEQREAAREKRRRWVGTVNDADAHRERGRQAGLAAAAAYLRQCGRDEWAAGLEAALGAKEE